MKGVIATLWRRLPKVPDIADVYGRRLLEVQGRSEVNLSPFSNVDRTTPIEERLRWNPEPGLVPRAD